MAQTGGKCEISARSNFPTQPQQTLKFKSEPTQCIPDLQKKFGELLFLIEVEPHPLQKWHPDSNLKKNIVKQVGSCGFVTLMTSFASSF